MVVFTLIFPLKVLAHRLDKSFVMGEHFGTGILSVAGECQVAKDAPNFCSGWVSMMVFSLIFPLKVLAHRLDKGFVIG